MKISKAESKDKKYKKARYGHTEDGGSVKLIVRIQIDQAEKLKKGKK